MKYNIKEIVKILFITFMIMICLMILNSYFFTQKEFFETFNENEDENEDEEYLNKEEKEDNHEKKNKKRIAILISGQTRSNSLGYDTSKTTVLDLFTKNLFNDELKENYEYDVFIATDNINIDKCKKYFGDHLKNMYVSNQNFHLHPMKQTITPMDTFQKSYHEKIKKPYQNHENNIHQLYRLYYVYQLMKDYEEDHFSYDYIIRSRFDLRIDQNVIPYIQKLNDDPELHICGVSDLFAIGRYDIMQTYMKLIEHIGNYNMKNKKYTFQQHILNEHNHEEYYKLIHSDTLRWTYAIEIQLMESILEYIQKNKYSMNKSMLFIPNIIHIQRL